MSTNLPAHLSEHSDGENVMCSSEKRNVNDVALLVALTVGILLMSDVPAEAKALREHIIQVIWPDAFAWFEYFEKSIKAHPIITSGISFWVWIWGTLLAMLLNNRRLAQKILRTFVQSSYTTFTPDGLEIEEEWGGNLWGMFDEKLIPRKILNVSEDTTPDNVILPFHDKNMEEVLVSAIHTTTMTTGGTNAWDNSAKKVLWKKSEKVRYVWVLTNEPRYVEETWKIYKKWDKGATTTQKIRYMAFPEVQFKRVREFLQEQAKAENITYKEVLEKASVNDSEYSDELILKILRMFFNLTGDESIDNMLETGKLKRNVDRKRILVMIHALRHEKRGGYLKRFDLKIFS